VPAHASFERDEAYGVIFHYDAQLGAGDAAGIARRRRRGWAGVRPIGGSAGTET